MRPQRSPLSLAVVVPFSQALKGHGDANGRSHSDPEKALG